jgi:hypothetical protein
MRRIGIDLFRLALAIVILLAVASVGQGQANPATGVRFKLADRDLHSPVTIIAYGDTRFTDPSNVTATSPTARKALIARITEEAPDGVLINGDLPWHGGNRDDYSVYVQETREWRDVHLRIFPVLGNHEFAQCDVQKCLENWWETFPELRGVRWYSAQLGSKVYAIALDTDDSLLPDTEQAQWLKTQLASLPREVKFVLIALHHPPVADIQRNLFADHNPRPNEIALANQLKDAARKSRAKFVVIAGHIHNYERFAQDGITYIVSGGGGARPYPVERMPSDVYQDSSFPNYHYVKFVLSGNALKGTMYRLTNLDNINWEVKDTFVVNAN